MMQLVTVESKGLDTVDTVSLGVQGSNMSPLERISVFPVKVIIPTYH